MPFSKVYEGTFATNLYERKITLMHYFYHFPKEWSAKYCRSKANFKKNNLKIQRCVLKLQENKGERT